MTIDVFPMPRGAYPDQLGVIGGWAVTSWFGGRPNPFTGAPSWHGGMDFRAPRLTPMYAVKNGTVVQAWDSSGGGWWTTLRCDDGTRYGYGHADHYVPGVNGRWVPAGTHIAYVDSSGSSTGDHLHFARALSWWGPWQDPYDELVDAARRGAFPGSRIPTSGPLPTPDSLPQHPGHDPLEALVIMQYWHIKGRSEFFGVDVAPSLAGAVATDGQAASPDHLVGGVFKVHIDSPQKFQLVAGAGASPAELDPATPGHQALIDELDRLPLVYQAA